MIKPGYAPYIKSVSVAAHSEGLFISWKNDDETTTAARVDEHYLLNLSQTVYEK